MAEECPRCTFSESDWRHTILCGNLDESQKTALMKLAVMDMALRGEIPGHKETTDAER